MLMAASRGAFICFMLHPAERQDLHDMFFANAQLLRDRKRLQRQRGIEYSGLNRKLLPLPEAKQPRQRQQQNDKGEKGFRPLPCQ